LRFVFCKSHSRLAGGRRSLDLECNSKVNCHACKCCDAISSKRSNVYAAINARDFSVSKILTRMNNNKIIKYQTCVVPAIRRAVEHSNPHHGGIKSLHLKVTNHTGGGPSITLKSNKLNALVREWFRDMFPRRSGSLQATRIS
jgi:hypothetical protein